jgi:hypothetical protein
LHYPELIKEVPDDVTLLNWGYAENHKFENCRIFADAGRTYYCCPGTSSWVSLFPRTEVSRENIRKFAAAGRENLASGLLNTDWGDGGHYNFMEYSWYGFLFGAEQAWNTQADIDDYDRRLSTVFYGDKSGAMGRAVRNLGKVSSIHVDGYYQSALRHAYFLPAQNDFFTKVKAKDAEALLDAIGAARQTFVAAQTKGEASNTADYLVFAADTMTHAAKRIAAFGQGGKIGAGERKKLGREYARLQERFTALWLTRNRPSEIGITHQYYEDVAKADYGK